jgi:hypothetical protein
MKPRRRRVVMGVNATTGAIGEAKPTEFPACFNSAQGYAEWREWVRKAVYICTPCDDCTAAYSHQMQRAGRCDADWVRARFRVRG